MYYVIQVRKIHAPGKHLRLNHKDRFYIHSKLNVEELAEILRISIKDLNSKKISYKEAL